MRLHKNGLFFPVSSPANRCFAVGNTLFGLFPGFTERSGVARSLRDAPQTGGINYLLYGLWQDNGEASIEEIFF